MLDQLDGGGKMLGHGDDTTLTLELGESVVDDGARGPTRADQPMGGGAEGIEGY